MTCNVAGGFGFIFGTVAMLLRRQSDLVQFVLGSLLMGGAELGNLLGLTPGVSWTFAANWPLGISSVWLRTLVLSFAGGIFVLIVNAMARALYERRLRLG